MARWCRLRRGSVKQIAAEVVGRGGKVGVHHATVSRTLAGKEFNQAVITAFERYQARKRALA